MSIKNKAKTTEYRPLLVSSLLILEPTTSTLRKSNSLAKSLSKCFLIEPTKSLSFPFFSMVARNSLLDPNSLTTTSPKLIFNNDFLISSELYG